MTPEEQIKSKQWLLFLYSVILAQTCAIIILWTLWQGDSSKQLPAEHFTKEYQRRQDSADAVIRSKDSVIDQLQKRRVVRDSIRFIDRKKEKQQHEEINNFNDSIRNIWWDSTFRSNNVR